MDPVPSAALFGPAPPTVTPTTVAVQSEPEPPRRTADHARAVEPYTGISTDWWQAAVEVLGYECPYNVPGIIQLSLGGDGIMLMVKDQQAADSIRAFVDASDRLREAGIRVTIETAEESLGRSGLQGYPAESLPTACSRFVPL
jgi:hypothetical protein